MCEMDQDKEIKIQCAGAAVPKPIFCSVGRSREPEPLL